MRLFRLLRVAAAAERLRWQRLGRFYAFRAGFGAVAAVFALLVVIMLHIAGFIALSRGRDAAVAALAVGAFDLVLAALFASLAFRGLSDPTAIEARQVRDDALGAVSRDAAQAAIYLPLMRSAVPLMRSSSAKKGLFGAAFAALVVGLIAKR